jgi:ABC-type nitrate/sulfonate/bicarbonate transport system permease component
MSSATTTAEPGAAVAAAEEPFDLAAHRQARRRARTRRVATGAAGLIAVIGLWQAAAAILRDQVVLPSPAQTAHAFAHYLHRPYPSQSRPLWDDLLISLRRILTGFAIGVVAGVALGAAMSASRVLRHLIDPVIEVIRPLPPLAFIPRSSSGSGSASCPRR